MLWAEALKPGAWSVAPYYLEIRPCAHYNLMTLETTYNQKISRDTF